MLDFYKFLKCLLSDTVPRKGNMLYLTSADAYTSLP